MDPKNGDRAPLGEILEQNKGIDRKVVEEFERLNSVQGSIRVASGSEYKLDQPFAVIHAVQATFKNVAGPDPD